MRRRENPVWGPAGLWCQPGLSRKRLPRAKPLCVCLLGFPASWQPDGTECVNINPFFKVLQKQWLVVKNSEGSEGWKNEKHFAHLIPPIPNSRSDSQSSTFSYVLCISQNVDIVFTHVSVSIYIMKFFIACILHRDYSINKCLLNE